MYDEAVVHRFQSERQSLAIMDHPAIAKVFDAGATPQGQPYFVMEYVAGSPITDYCDQQRLSIGDRLELFIQVCEGVQHAHQKAIIHRDLKPANILVVEVDGKPLPRIIDFGLAKATTPAVAGETLFTQLGQFLGTPGYMSPEQIDLSVRDIDTRTDVYSLGVVLYVLLTGLQPFETATRQKEPLDELLRKLREEEPPTPSAKISADRVASAATAAARSTERKQLVSLLRGDLDWITMKALERDRARRYGAPSEFAADIRRYLNHEPVEARPASAGYRLRKYTRRHRVALGVGAGLVMLLTAFTALQTQELRRTTRERDRANRITDFMTGMFKVADPNEARGNSVTAREILDKASNEIGAGLAKDPEVQSQMMHLMASTYLNLGLYARAHALATRALDARVSLLGPDDPQTLESMTQLGWILNREGNHREAEKLERQALLAERRILGPEAPLTLQTMDHLAVIEQYQGHYGEEEKLEREVIEVETRVMGPDSEQRLRAMNNLGLALLYQARYVEGEQEFRQLVDAGRRVWGPEHPRTVTAMGNLALAIQLQGRLAEAEPLYRENLAALQRVLGPEHPNTTVSMDGLADLLSAEGRLADAEKLLRETVEIRLRTLGPEHLDTLRSESNLADTLVREGHVQEAERLQRETLAIQLRVSGPESPDALRSQSGLTRILISEGHDAQAEKIGRETFAIQLRTLGPQHPDTLNTLQQLGIALADTDRYSQAAELFRDVIEQGSKSTGQGNRWSAWYAFACVAAAANHPDDALRYLREALDHGYRGADGLVADGDLKNLRPNAKFQQLIAELRRRPADFPHQ
jgi:non-specific serine/threonine protein kinase/serine/threonine-protein kinase